VCFPRAGLVETSMRTGRAEAQRCFCSQASCFLLLRRLITPTWHSGPQVQRGGMTRSLGVSSAPLRELDLKNFTCVLIPAFSY
jgi:hypothetical protein